MRVCREEQGEFGSYAGPNARPATALILRSIKSEARHICATGIVIARCSDPRKVADR